jgi:membrane-associated phospholipid phosphatase
MLAAACVSVAFASQEEHDAMKPSLLAITLIAIFSCPGRTLCADQYPSPGLQLAPVTNDAANVSVKRRDYLLPYQDTEGPKKYLEWLWKDPANLLTRPVFWDGEQWKTFGIEAGITGALFPLDNTVRDFVHDDNRSASLDDGLNTVRTITGAGAYYFAASGAIFGSGLIVQNEKLADSGFLAFESVAYAGALEEGIKFVTGRKRPDSARNQFQFRGPSGRAFNSSFVSGESTVAFAFASSVSEVWQNPWVTWPLYMFAGAVGAQRITDNKHWLSDVVGGAFLGHAVGKTIVRMHYSHDVEGKLVPYVADHTVGLQVTFEF